MKQKYIGWDIGGAHLKAALLDEAGRLQQTIQLPCALWKDLQQLETAITQALIQLATPAEAVRHSVTMTGELVDLFPNRRQGVIAIANLAARLLGEHVGFYAVDAHHRNGATFASLTQLADMTQQIASVNWHASACLVKAFANNALLIDMGSTTTDMVPILSGHLVDVGLSDAARLQQNSLIYTGVIRTPVMALSQQLMVDSVLSNVAAEYFATMADVYRLTGELDPAMDMADTADGQPKTPYCSARRLARMVGYDVEDKPMAVWRQLAQDCRTLQLNQLQSAAVRHSNKEMVIIGAGAGAFLVSALAAQLKLRYVSLDTLLAQQNLAGLALCLPAYAVAQLAYQSIRDVD